MSPAEARIPPCFSSGVRLPERECDRGPEASVEQELSPWGGGGGEAGSGGSSLAAFTAGKEGRPASLKACASQPPLQCSGSLLRQ